MPTATPREVVADLLRRTVAAPAEDTADLYSPDAVFEIPFLPPGVPQPEPGRETFRAHLRVGATVQAFDGIDDVEIHETTDPELVIAECRLRGRVFATGARFTQRAVMFVRVQAGLITWSRTYSNPTPS